MRPRTPRPPAAAELSSGPWAFGGRWLFAAALVLALISAALYAIAQRRFVAAVPVTTSAVPMMVPGDPKRGERLVRVLAACEDCHGQNLGGRELIDEPALGFVYAPNITPFTLIEWRDADLWRTLTMGVGAEGRALLDFGAHARSFEAAEDLAAAIAYLRAAPVVASGRAASEYGPLLKLAFGWGLIPSLLSAATLPTPVISAHQGGERLFSIACAGCHGLSGKGLPHVDCRRPGAWWVLSLPLRPGPTLKRQAIEAMGRQEFRRILGGAPQENAGGGAHDPAVARRFRWLEGDELNAIFQFAAGRAADSKVD